jgi:hypothetical protein
MARAETTLIPVVGPKKPADGPEERAGGPQAPAAGATSASAAEAALFGPLPQGLLEPVPVPPLSPRDADEPVDTDADKAGGCVVGVDIAREGRRLVGRRSAKVLRAAAGALAARLPDGARLELGEPGVLTVAVPGWGRAAASEWMHRELPGVLDGFVSDVDLTGMHLRAAVRSPSGPVGAQLLQRLDGPARAAGATERAPEGPSAGAGRRRTADDGEPVVDRHRAAPGSGRHSGADQEAGGARRFAVGRTDGAGTEPDGAAADTAAGGAVPPPEPPDHPRAGRGGRRRAAILGADEPEPAPLADDPAADEQEAGAAADSDQPAAAATGDPAPPRRRIDASTEGLGLADLLAGALAEYRGI